MSYNVVAFSLQHYSSSLMASESFSSRAASASPRHATPDILYVIIRFTTSIPDLNVEIENPSNTTVIFLKHRIRSQVPTSVASSRLRLIYGGKILNDTSTLSSALKLPTPPPKSSRESSKGKEKAVEPEPSRVYINCSIGDDLSEKELEAEKNAALAATTVLKPSKEAEIGAASSVQYEHLRTTPAPRGFDRLLSTGFSAAEIGQLRLQFMAIQSRSYTPNTMPSQAELRRMEDAWLDNNGVNDGTGPGGFGNDIAEGSMDILIWGSIIGFMWPLGAVGWAIREEGIWSKQMQMAVFTGFVLSLAFGVLRLMS